VEVAGSEVDGVGPGVLEDGGGSEDEGGGSVTVGEDDGWDGDEGGGGVPDGSAGKVVVTPFMTAETRPSGDWPRIFTSSPSSTKVQVAVTKEGEFTY